MEDDKVPFVKISILDGVANVERIDGPVTLIIEDWDEAERVIYNPGLEPIKQDIIDDDIE